MKLTFVLRNKKNALKISTKTIESFMERIKKDTKDGAVARRRKQLEAWTQGNHPKLLKIRMGQQFIYTIT